MVRSLLVSLLMVATALAGCAGGDDDGVPAAVDEEERQQHLRLDLQREDVIGGPDWQLGQWWGYHIFFGSDDAEGIHFNMAVVEDRGDQWLLATDHRVAAMFHAIFDFSTMGTFDKSTLDTTADNLPWEWYRWPLADGATWNSQVQFTDFSTGEVETVDVDWTVSYNPSIFTQDGQKPGFDVLGTVAGARFLEYDYVPYLGWFGHMYQYDLSPDAGPDDWSWHIMTMGSGLDWSGDYYVDEAVPLLEHDRSLFFNPDDPGQSHVGQEEPRQPVVLSEQADLLYGWLYSYAWSGDHETALVDPENQQQLHLTATATPADEFAFEFEEILVEPVLPGEWNVLTAGVGAVAGGGAFLWEIHEEMSAYPPA